MVIRSAITASLLAWGGVAHAGDASALAGHTVEEYIGADAVAAELRKSMGGDAYHELTHSTNGPGGVFELDGDYVVASGCRAHMCDEVFYAVAVHKKSGAAVIAFKGYEKRPRLWGKVTGRTPREVARVMSGNAFNDR